MKAALIKLLVIAILIGLALMMMGAGDQNIFEGCFGGPGDPLDPDNLLG